MTLAVRGSSSATGSRLGHDAWFLLVWSDLGSVSRCSSNTAPTCGAPDGGSRPGTRPVGHAPTFTLSTARAGAAQTTPRFWFRRRDRLCPPVNESEPAFPLRGRTCVGLVAGMVAALHGAKEAPAVAADAGSRDCAGLCVSRSETCFPANDRRRGRGRTSSATIDPQRPGGPPDLEKFGKRVATLPTPSATRNAEAHYSQPGGQRPPAPRSRQSTPGPFSRPSVTDDRERSADALLPRSRVIASQKLRFPLPRKSETGGQDGATVWTTC